MAALINNISNPTSVPFSGVTLAGQVFRIGSVDYLRTSSGRYAVSLTSFDLVEVADATQVVLIDAEIGEV